MLDEETRDGRGVTLSYIQTFYSVSHVAMFGILVGTVQFTALVQRLTIFFFYFVLSIIRLQLRFGS